MEMEKETRMEVELECGGKEVAGESKCRLLPPNRRSIDRGVGRGVTVSGLGTDSLRMARVVEDWLVSESRCGMERW